MNIVQSGSRLQVYGEDVKTFKEIPIGSYDVGFSQMGGFFLRERNDIVPNEEKIYGNHEEKVEKVLRSFKLSNRNFGVMLSGQKGIGKSLFMRILASRGIEAGYPVITVSDPIPGVSNFLASIDQEVIVLFDEFEKIFKGNDDYDPQAEFLSLFDGVDGGKKLFVITCNEVGNLNEFLVNRPGRFHYHFTIGNPTPEEVTEYLIDKLNPTYYDAIEKIVKLAQAINITYDYLRAIVFELNQGYSVEETLGDLNIVKTDSIYFDVFVTLSNGMTYSAMNIELDLFSKKERRIYLYPSRRNEDSYPEGLLYLSPSDIKNENGQLNIDVDKVKFNFDTRYWDEDDEKINQRLKELKAIKVTRIAFNKLNENTLSRYII